MNSKNRIRPRLQAIIAVSALTLGISASGSDLHLAEPPAGVDKETTVCAGRSLDDVDLLATICTTTWRNSIPGSEWRHAHVAAILKNTSSKEPRYVEKIEIVSEAGVVKASCLYRAYLKPNQTANCATGMMIDVGLPNMRIYLDWHMHEV